MIIKYGATDLGGLCTKNGALTTSPVSHVRTNYEMVKWNMPNGTCQMEHGQIMAFANLK